MIWFPSRQKAIDQALWQNHNHRYDDNHGVVPTSKGGYMVVSKDHPSFTKREFEIFVDDYSGMDYMHIRQIAMDEDPLNHFEEIRGMFSVLHGEILRYILEVKIPLDKFIRYELANRGYDKDHKWCGFEKAKEIWLK